MTSDQKTAPASPVASGMEVVGKAAGERAKMKSLADAALEQLQGAKSEAKPAEPEPDGTEPEA